MRRTLSSALLVILAACGVSTQQEVQMGAQYAQQINAQLPMINDPEIVRYINVLGDSIAKLSDDRNLEWHFFVVDSKEVNAFAVPGGYIYVNRGLIERADKMDQLAGAMGHEIGHVLERHSIKQMEKQQTGQVAVGLGCVLLRACDSQGAQELINVGATAVFAKFSRADEAQADSVGVRDVVRAGIDPRGIPELFQKLIEERRTRPTAVDAWFQTHPLEEDRIRATEALIARIDPTILNSLTQDTPNFQAFKQRLRSLPPSPPTKAQ